MKTKTNWKNRILSALLVFAILLPYVPEGLFPKAEATYFEKTHTLSVDEYGGYTATFETSDTSANDPGGNAYFVLMPDIGLNTNGTASTPGIVAADSPSALQTYLSNEESGLGLSTAAIGTIVRTSSNIPLTNGRIYIESGVTSGYSDLPSLDDIYAALKACYGSAGFYVRGNSTLITDPATQLGDAGIPYVAILYSNTDPANWTIATDVYQGFVEKHPDLKQIEFVHHRSGTAAAAAIASNAAIFANDDTTTHVANSEAGAGTYVGSLTNDGEGAAILVKDVEVSLTNVANGALTASGKLYPDRSGSSTALAVGGRIDPGETYYLQVTNQDTGNWPATATVMPISGYAKVTYRDASDEKATERILVIPVRILYTTAQVTLGLSAGYITGTFGSMSSATIIDPDIYSITGANGPRQTTEDAVKVDQVKYFGDKGKEENVNENKWIRILDEGEDEKNELKSDEYGINQSGTQVVLENGRKVAIRLTEDGLKLPVGLHVETLSYKYTAGNQNKQAQFTVFIEVLPAQAMEPTLSPAPTSSTFPEYFADPNNSGRQDPVYDYTLGDWGTIDKVEVDGQELKKTGVITGDSWSYSGGKLTLKSEALDTLGLPSGQDVTVRVTFGTPPADKGRTDDVVRTSKLTVKGQFQVKVTVTADVDNYSHGKITLQDSAGNTVEVNTGSGPWSVGSTTNAAGVYAKDYTYTGNDTKVGTEYTVWIGDVETTQKVTVDSPNATLNFRTVIAKADASAGKVGIGDTAAKAQTNATDDNDKQLTRLVENKDGSAVYLYAQPATGYGGAAIWTYVGTSGSTGNDAASISALVATTTKPTEATASYGGTGVKVKVNINSSAANSWVVELWKASGTSAYKTATVTSGVATFTGLDAEAYTIYVKSAGSTGSWADASGDAKSTGETITAVAGKSDTETTLNFYTVQLGTYSNGTATIDGATSAVTVLASANSPKKSVALVATPNTDYSFNTWSRTPTGTDAVVGAFGDKSEGTTTWTIATSYSGTGPITLTPSFNKTSYSGTITVNLDAVATAGKTLTFSSSTSGAATPTVTDNGDGTYSYSGATAGATYTVGVSGWTGTGSISESAPSPTLNYYTVTANDGTGSTGATTSASTVIAGTAVTLTSGPDKAKGYGGDGAWTLNPNPDTASGSPIGSASTIANGGKGTSATLTVNGKVTATASYTPNKITINVYMNGAADATTNRVITLRKNGTDTAGAAIVGTAKTTGASATGGNGDSKAEFTPVAQNGSNDTSTYYIYVDGVYTGVTVDCAVGGTASKTLYFYQVMLDTVAETTATVTASYTKTSGGTAVTKTANNTARQEVAVILANGSSAYNSFTITTTATKVNNKDFSWTAKGGNGSGSAINTWTDPAKNSSSWTWNNPGSYTTAGAIVLSPNYADNGNYSLTINVYKDDDKNLYTNTTPIEVVLTKGGTTLKKTTTTGTVTFDDLNGTYTASVTDWVGTKTGVGTTADQTNGVTLKYWTVSFGANAGGSVSSATVNSAADTSKIYIDGTSYSGTSKADAGYTVAGWDVSRKTDPTATADTSATTSSGTNISGTLTGTTTLTAKFTQNGITGNPADQTYTYGTAVNATPATFSIPGDPTGNYTYSNITVTGLPPGLTLKFGGVDYAAGTTSYSGTASVTITGKPADITDTDAVITFDVKGPTGAIATGKSFKIKVNPATPTFTVEENTATVPHYAGDSAPAAVTVNVSGPYYNGNPNDNYDADKWVTLTTSSTDPVLKLDYSIATLTGTSGNCNVKVTGSVDTTDNGKKALSRVWTKDSDDADVPMSGTGKVIVNVTRNDDDYPTMNGKTVELKKSGTVVKNGSGALAPYTDTAGGATSPSKEMVELENVPTDTAAYNVFVNGTDVNLTVTVKTGDNTVNVKYYDYSYDPATPANASESVTGMPTDPSDPVLSGTKVTQPGNPSLTGYTFKGWTTTSGGSASIWTNINTITKETTFYAVWEALGVTLADMTAKGALGLNGIIELSTLSVGGGGGSGASDYEYAVTATLGKGGDNNAHGITVTALNNDDNSGLYGFAVSGTPDTVGEVKFEIQATSKKNKEPKKATLTVTVEQVYTVVYNDNGATLDPAHNVLPTDSNKYTESGKTYGSTATLTTITADSSNEPQWLSGARALNGWALTSSGAPAGSFGISAAKGGAAADGTITLYAIWADGSLGMSTKSLTAEYNMTKAQWDANYASASPTCTDSSVDLATLVSGGSGSYTFTVTGLPSWMEFDGDHTISMKGGTERVGDVKSGGYVVTVNLTDTGLDNATASTTVTINVLKTTPVIVGLAEQGAPHYAGDSTMDAMTYTEVQDPYDANKKLSTVRNTDIGRWTVDDTTFDAGTKTYTYTYTHAGSDAGNYNTASGTLEMEAIERSIGIVTGTSGDEDNFDAAYVDSTNFTTTQTYDPATNQITVTVGITNKADSNSPIEKFSVTSTDAAAPFSGATTTSAVGTGGMLTTALDKGDSLDVFTFTVNLGQTNVGEYSVTFDLTAEAGFKADGTQLASHKSATAKYTYKLKIVPKLLDHATIAGLVAPVTNATPTAKAALSGTDSNKTLYEVTSIAWAANDSKFAAGKKYTATITLTANANYLFTVPKSQDGGEDGSACTGYAVTIGSSTDTATVAGTTTSYGTLKYDPNITAGVDNAQKTVKLIYEFNPTAAGGPVPVLTEKSFSTADLVSIEAASSEKMDFYYLINTTAPGATGAPDAAAVLAAGKAAADQFAGKVTSADPSGGKVTWSGSPKTLTGLTPGATYYVHVVAVPTGKETPLSAVGSDSAELPKKLTVSISAADGSLNTTPVVAVSAVNVLTGTTAVANLNSTKTASGDLSVVKSTTAGKFDPAPNVPNTETNHSSTWAIKSITIKESATLTGTPAEITGSPNTTDPYTYDQPNAAAVTVVEMVFRKRITRAVISDKAETDGTVTLTVNSATIGGTAVTNTDLDDTDLALSYAWAYKRGSGAWTTISGATGRSFNYDPNNAAYAGASFQVTVTYGKTEDKTLGGDPSVVTADFDAGNTKLHTPEPDLVMAEKGQSNGATDAENAEGGLFLSFPPIQEDDGTSNRVKEYEIILTKNGTQIGTTLKFTAQDTTKMRDGNYVYHWPADLTNIKPDDKFEVKVKAYAQDGSGYDDSDWGTDDEETNIAGRKVLNLADWGVLEDRTFNGHSHRGTTPETANILKTTKANAAYTAGVGNIHVYYIDSEPDGDPSTKADKKLHVNITEDGKNDYYVYVEVDKGALYLPLEYTKYTTDETWQIKQAKPTMAVSNPNPNGSTDTKTNIYPSPKVTYNTGDATGEGGDAIYNKGTITDYYEIVFTVESAPGGSTWVGKSPSVTDLQNFVADKQGTYTFKATAKYLDPEAEGVTLPAGANTAAAYEQFKADVGVCEATFSFTTQLRHVDNIKLERYEAVNGAKGVTGVDTDIENGNKNLTEDRPVAYGTPVAAIENDGTAGDGVTPVYARLGYYNAGNNTEAKEMRLEGLKIIVTWDTKDVETFVVGKDTLPAGLFTWSVQASTPATAPTADNDYALKFARAGETTLFVEADGKKSTNGVPFKMTTCPLPYTITANPTERVWNGTDVATGSNVAHIPPNLDGDNVYINATYRVPNANVGKDKTVTARTAAVAGTHAGFYHVGRETTSTLSIIPRLIDSLQLTIEAKQEDGTYKADFIGRPIKDAVLTINETDVDPLDVRNINGWDLEDPATAANRMVIPVDKWEILELGADPNDEANWSLVPADANFYANRQYRPTFTLKADTNHYFKFDQDNYKVQGLKNGEAPDMDQLYKTVITVEEETPYHPEWHPEDEENGRKLLYNNIAVFMPILDLTVTPELQFSDVNDADVGDARGPLPNLPRAEQVTQGDDVGTYTVSLQAAVMDVHDVTVFLPPTGDPKGNLLRLPAKDPSKPTVTLTWIPGEPGEQATQGGNVTAKKMVMGVDKLHFKLDLSNVDTSSVEPGKYYLYLNAKGSQREGEMANDVSAAYSFTLVINKKEEPKTEYIPSGGGGTTVIETPVVRYMVTSYGFTSDLTAEKLARKGAKPSFVPKITPVSGLKFLGWSEENPATLKDGKLPTLVDPLTFSISEDKVFYAVYEQMAVGHTHYVIGFPDGTFGPDHQITRGQVATIIARACLENFVEGGDYGNPGNYSDVESHWAYSAISYCSLNGVFTGYDDGTFRPDQYITRQELATVVARLAGVQVNQGLPFSDSGDIASWALNGVYTNYANKWVNGYTDGTFKPLNDITRAETVKIFNGYLGRGTDKEGLSQLHEYVHEGVASNNTESSENNEYMTWPDVVKTHWAYYEVIEAANDHNFYWRDVTADVPPENWNEAFIDETWRYQDDANDGADNVGRGDLPVLTVTYVVKSNGVTWDSVTEEVKMYSSPDPAKLPKAEPSEGYRFAGWSETDPDTGEISLIDPTEHPVLEDRTFYAIFEPDVYVMPKVTITYVIGDHGSTDMELTEIIDMWQSPDPEKLPKITAHEGWRFAGWSETDPATGVITSTDPTDHPALEDSVFYAVYESTDPNYVPAPVVSTEPTEPPVEEPLVEEPPVEEPPAEEPPVEEPPVEEPPVEEPPVEEPPVEEPPVEEPPVEEPPVEEPPVEEPPVEEPPVEEPPVEEPPVEEPPVEEPPVEEPPVKYVRYSYINGYEDNTFHPDEEFTRATVAAIIANLRGYDPSVTYESAAFDDLDGHWASNSIAFCVSQGLMSGYTDNTFRPDNAISRQEFAVVLARVAGVTESGELPFADADSIAPYAKDSVYTAYAKGWIGGYDDGTFLPERNVTRAEAVKMINGFMGRGADPEYIENQSFYKVFDDVPETHWAYYEIIEATNTWNQ